ncbi:MAG: glucose-6-phosphate isomerase [Longispora sp.]|nr:glucose-6-phosphate isomerase [Longispora sp. (in: high G+C Gram-positive bacteria)]
MISGGGLSVRSDIDSDEVLRELNTADVPALLAAGDVTLWGPEAESEASIRLGWLHVLQTSRDLLPRLTKLRAELKADGLDHIVLAGMGGSSLAPEVICRTLGVALTVLDTTDPHQVAGVIADRLERTVLVTSSKSGGTVETDSHRRAFIAAGLDPARQLVVVTDPGSPLETEARELGAREIFLADPNVGGRYSALTAFGLVPSALAGVNVSELLEEAGTLHATLSAPDGPAVTLGAALGAAVRFGRDKLAIADDGTGIVGLGDWIEQLVAESTGKHGNGILPVVLEKPSAPVAGRDDVVLCTVGGAVSALFVPGGGVAPDISVSGGLGAQFMAWEFATAVAGRVIGINPFDQPNVQESKDNTSRILAEGVPSGTPTFTEGNIEVFGSGTNLAEAVDALLEQMGPGDYLAIMTYLDRREDAAIAEIRPLLAKRAGLPVTFGWAPRFLHSTGQYHKGGPQTGVYLQVTGATTRDVDIEGRPYSFATLQAAQAAGDREALVSRKRPILHLHLTDRAEGIAQLLATLR